MIFRLATCSAVLVVLFTASHVPGASTDGPYAQAVLADNPIGYWRLSEEDSSVAQDVSGNNLHGFYTGDVTRGEQGALLGEADASTGFDGETGHVDVNARAELNQLTNDFTLEAWLKHREDAWAAIASTRVRSGTRSGYAFGLTDNDFIFEPNRPYFSLFGIGDYVLDTPIPDEQWTHLAVVFDASNNVNFYVNGEHEGTIAADGPARPNSQEFHIGQNPVLGGAGHHSNFGGNLDEVAVYGRSLGAEEIREHYLAAQVPEPSTVVLLAMGMVGLLTRVRRRRS